MIENKSIDARKLLDTMRTLESKTKVTKGTPAGDAKAFVLNCPVLAMAVRPLSEAMDYNRFIQVTTQKVDGMPDTLTLLRQIFSEEDMDLIRKSTSIVPHRYSKVFEK